MPGLEWRGTPAGTGIGTGLKYTSLHPRFSGVLQAKLPKRAPPGAPTPPFPLLYSSPSNRSASCLLLGPHTPPLSMWLALLSGLL